MPTAPFALRFLHRFNRPALCAAAALALGLGTPARAEHPLLAMASPIDGGRETRATAKESPSSTLDAQSALIAASAIAGQIPGAIVMTVLPTGSMRPMFDEKAYLVLEPTPFENIQVGDIITYQHPQLGVPIVHRVFEKHGRSLWTKGDHNDRPDNVYVTAANYRMRVVAVIYSRGASGTLAMSGEAVRSVSMMN